MRLGSFFGVKYCCCFVSLQTGTKIIGFIYLLLCFWSSVSYLWVLIELAKEKKPIQPMLVLDLTVVIVQMITSVFLLLGAYQEKAKFLRPWLLVTMFSAVLQVVFMQSQVAEMMADTQFGTYSGWLIFFIFFLVIDLYTLLVVFSYYRSLAPQGQENIT